MNKTIVAPSILACNWGSFTEEIAAVDRAGADWIHVDVMDGHFVPPITFGPGVVKAARRATKLTLDVHLMIEHPERQIDAFAEAGADIITVHEEAQHDCKATLAEIRAKGIKVGLSIKPETPVESVEPYINDIDLLLIMTVNPGWGGQKFIAESPQKIQAARELIENSGREIHLEVDGGINAETSAIAVSSGANALVAGTAVFGTDDYTKAITELRAA